MPVAIVRERVRLNASLYETLQILGLTMSETTPLDQLLALDTAGAIPPELANRLKLFETEPDTTDEHCQVSEEKLAKFDPV